MQNTLNDRDSTRPAAAYAVHPRLDWKMALWAGIMAMMFPWFTEARNWISVVSHVVFGVVLAGAYVALRRR